MNQDNIKLTLSFCRPSSKFFQVSHVFDSIYFEIVYETKRAKNKILIESYEQNHEFISMIKSKGIQCGHYDFWFKIDVFDVKIFIWTFLNHFMLLINRFTSDGDLSWSYKQYNVKVIAEEKVSLIDNKLNNIMSVISKNGHAEIICNGICHKSRNGYGFKIGKSDLWSVMHIVYISCSLAE